MSAAATPPTRPPGMKAVTLDAFGTPPAVRTDLARPTPAGNEVLVRVRASSANPVDNAIAAGMLSGMVEHEFPVVLGRDYAGVVEQVGSAVERSTAGDEVYGFVLHANPTVHDGSWAEFITVPDDASIAPSPRGVDLATAGAAPLAAITAMALPEDEEYLRGLGVSELLARTPEIATTVRERHPGGVDAVLDLVSYAPGAFDAALKPGGRVASPNAAAGDGPGRTNVMAVPSSQNLERLAELLEAGMLKVPVQDTYELGRAGEALQALGTTHIQGKLAIRIA